MSTSPGAVILQLQRWSELTSYVWWRVLLPSDYIIIIIMSVQYGCALNAHNIVYDNIRYTCRYVGRIESIAVFQSNTRTIKSFTVESPIAAAI